MSSPGGIAYAPSQGLSYDPAEPKYWDPVALDKEVLRAFEICAGCRMCFKYCDSFPDLFALLDGPRGGDVRQLTETDKDKVFDACFQCKLCEVQCPYTPRDKHEFLLDFPKLVHRFKAVRAKQRGLRWREKLLGNPDAAGRLARASFGMANVMNRVSLHRWFLEKALGIHRKKLLPPFARSTFERWAQRAGKPRAAPGVETVLFPTCYVQNNEPQIGRDTLEVLEKNCVPCGWVEGLACCGMPAWESGDLAALQRQAKQNLDRLAPLVKQGSMVLVVNPTCSMMMRREYPELVAPEDRPRARELAAAVRDPGEYLWSIRDQARFNTDFRSTPGASVAYHAPCHLRAQAVGFKGRDLLRKIPGVVPHTTLECCGHDGTYAMRVEGFEPSQRAGRNAFQGMAQAGAEVWATDCPLARIQFAQHAGKLPLHPMTILARAYRPDGFPTQLASKPPEAPT
jgi:Fe-S oxidoreductase